MSRTRILDRHIPCPKGPALTTPELSRTQRWLVALDRMIGAVTASALVLVLPLSLLLFLQWPLRDLVQAYSREANDLAQWLFALYVSVAITYATRQRSHLAADALARNFPLARRARLYRLAMAVRSSAVVGLHALGGCADGLAIRTADRTFRRDLQPRIFHRQVGGRVARVARAPAGRHRRVP